MMISSTISTFHTREPSRPRPATREELQQQFDNRVWSERVANQAKIAKELQALDSKFSVITTIPQGNAGFRVVVNGKLNDKTIELSIPCAPNPKNPTGPSIFGQTVRLESFAPDGKFEVTSIESSKLAPGIRNSLKNALGNIRIGQATCVL